MKGFRLKTIVLRMKGFPLLCCDVALSASGHRSGRIGGFSKVALGHRFVFLVSGLAGQASSTVGPSSHVYATFLC